MRRRRSAIVAALEGAVLAGLSLELFLRAMGPGPHDAESRRLRRLVMAGGALWGALGLDDDAPIQPPWESAAWWRRVGGSPPQVLPEHLRRSRSG